ncbi:MAG: hypothetical protein JRH20_28105 [Deltaproteobacteria bacterium]|nr:hypothetical protein [Deltaproteobacteria bacterium]
MIDFAGSRVLNFERGCERERIAKSNRQDQRFRRPGKKGAREPFARIANSAYFVTHSKASTLLDARLECEQFSTIGGDEVRSCLLPHQPAVFCIEPYDEAELLILAQRPGAASWKLKFPSRIGIVGGVVADENLSIATNKRFGATELHTSGVLESPEQLATRVVEHNANVPIGVGAVEVSCGCHESLALGHRKQAGHLVLAR